MRPSLYEVYVHLVSLAALAGGIICVLGGLYAGIGVVHPDAVMKDHEWEYHQANDRYWEWTDRRHTDSGWAARAGRPSDEELTRRRLESLEIKRGSVRRESWVSLIMFGAGLLISLVMFTVHWRLGRTFRTAPLPQPHA
jgi:hypothetical protein